MDDTSDFSEAALQSFHSGSRFSLPSQTPPSSVVHSPAKICKKSKMQQSIWGSIENDLAGGEECNTHNMPFTIRNTNKLAN